jgi:hypothetical protein
MKKKYLITLLNLTNKILIYPIILTTSYFYGQEMATKTQPALQGNIAYFIGNKLVPPNQLKTIKYDDIESSKIVKRDTIIKNEKYTSQIFVLLKQTAKKED